MAQSNPNPSRADEQIFLFFMEDRFSPIQAQVSKMLYDLMAYVMRDSVFIRGGSGRFVCLAIEHHGWACMLSSEQRAFLRSHSEACYIAKGFPPSEDPRP